MTTPSGPSGPPDEENLPKLNRIPFFDSRSRNFAVRETLGPPISHRKRVWSTIKTPLDQGREGACVGFSWAQELGATPRKFKVSNEMALDFYRMAQQEDRAMGNNWPEGASILAGARAMKKVKNITRYYWAFSTEDVLQALMRKGPVVIGINWYSGMYRTRHDGLVEITGRVVGGHAIMVNGYWPRHPIFGDVVLWQNSWGAGYGLNGLGYVRVEDLDRLLHEQGEACVPTDSPIR